MKWERKIWTLFFFLGCTLPLSSIPWTWREDEVGRQVLIAVKNVDILGEKNFLIISESGLSFLSSFDCKTTYVMSSPKWLSAMGNQRQHKMTHLCGTEKKACPIPSIKIVLTVGLGEWLLISSTVAAPPLPLSTEHWLMPPASLTLHPDVRLTTGAPQVCDLVVLGSVAWKSEASRVCHGSKGSQDQDLLPLLGKANRRVRSRGLSWSIGDSYFLTNSYLLWLVLVLGLKTLFGDRYLGLRSTRSVVHPNTPLGVRERLEGKETFLHWKWDLLI